MRFGGGDLGFVTPTEFDDSAIVVGRWKAGAGLRVLADVLVGRSDGERWSGVLRVRGPMVVSLKTEGTLDNGEENISHVARGAGNRELECKN